LASFPWALRWPCYSAVTSAGLGSLALIILPWQLDYQQFFYDQAPVSAAIGIFPNPCWIHLKPILIFA
jgi:hypothetical protein